MPLESKQLFLKPEEQKFIGMSVVSVLDQLESTARNQRIPWNPESRKTIKDMIDAGKGLKIKLAKLGFDMRPLPDLEPGEENDYLTKES